MKKILLIAATALISLSASAQKVPTFKVTPSQFESKANVTTLHRGQLSKFESTLLKQNKGVKTPDMSMFQNTASARKAPRNVITPKGDPKWYSYSGYVNTWLGLMFSSGIADQVCFDGNDVYIKNLFPGDFEELWCRGTLSKTEAGDSIVTFDPKEILTTADVYDSDYNPITVELGLNQFVLDEAGEKIEEESDLVMNIKNGTIYIDDDMENPSIYIGLVAYQEGEKIGYLSYTLAVTLDPVTVPLDLVEIPASATVKQYVYDYIDSYLAPVCTLGNVAVDGNDYYFTNLGFEGTIKGTKKDGNIHIPVGQFVGATTYFLFNGAFVTEWGYDDDYNLIADMKDEVVLTYNEATDTYTLEGENMYSGTVTLEGSLFEGGTGIVVTPFAGLKPATPSDPTGVSVEYYEDYGQYCIQATVMNKDVDGNYIALENMELSIIADDEPIEFTAEDGYYISENITWMPYGWADDQGGYDISFTNTTPFCYVYDGLFDKIGVQVRYTCDGVTKYSNIVYPDDEDGVNTVLAAEEKPISFYDLQGRRTNAHKGIVIANGKKYMVK